MEDILFIVSEVLSVAVVIGLIIGQYRLGRKVYDLKSVAVWSERRIAELEAKAAAAPAVKTTRKTAVKEEAK